MKITPGIEEFSAKIIESQYEMQRVQMVFIGAFLMKRHNMSPDEANELPEEEGLKIKADVEKWTVDTVNKSGMPNGLLETLNAFKGAMGDMSTTMPAAFVEARYEEFITEQFIKAADNVAKCVVDELGLSIDEARNVGVVLCQGRIQGVL